MFLYFMKGGNPLLKSLANSLKQSWWWVGDAKKTDSALNNERDETFQKFGKLLRAKLTTGDAKKAGNQCFSTWLTTILTTETCFRRTQRPITIILFIHYFLWLKSVWSVCHPSQSKTSTRHKSWYFNMQIKFQTDIIDF